MSSPKTPKSTVEIFYEDSAGVVRTTSAGFITKGRCRLGSILLTSGSNAGSVSIYDGEPLAQNLLMVIEDNANISNFVDYKFSVKFDRGIYVTLSGTGASVTVTYLPIF